MSHKGIAKEIIFAILDRKNKNMDIFKSAKIYEH